MTAAILMGGCGQNEGAKTQQESTGQVISKEKALEIVLARVEGAGEENVRMELEKKTNIGNMKGKFFIIRENMNSNLTEKPEKFSSGAKKE